MFFHLYLIIYHILYGVDSPILPVRPNIVSEQQISKILTTATRIENKLAPEEVVQAVARRTTNLNSRQAVFYYYCQEVQVA
jgi:hypothetical protein